MHSNGRELAAHQSYQPKGIGAIRSREVVYRMTVHCVECFFSQYVILPVTCHTNANPFQRLQLLITDSPMKVAL